MPLNTLHDCLDNLGDRLPFVSAAQCRCKTTHPRQIWPARIPRAWAAKACNDTLPARFRRPLEVDSPGGYPHTHD